MKKFLILTLSVILIIGACNKKPVVVPNREDMFKTGRWTIASGTVKMRLPDGRDTVINYMNYLPLCRQDDYWIFRNGHDGAVYSSTNKCDPSDADSMTFNWYLNDNMTTLSLNSNYQFFYGIKYIIRPLVFDSCLSTGGFGQPAELGVAPCDPLVVDTLYGVNDTLPGFTRSLIVLDSLWRLKFDSVGLVYNTHYNSTIVNFSQKGFTLNFWVYTTYPNWNNFHTGAILVGNLTGGFDTVDHDPIILPDTLKYTINFVNH